VKVGQVTGMAAVGVVSVGAPTAVAVVGRVYYWIIEWLVALPWHLFERAKGTATNLPWPKGKKRERLEDPPKEYLLVIPRKSPGGAALAGMLSSKDDKVVPDGALVSPHRSAPPIAGSGTRTERRVDPRSHERQNRRSVRIASPPAHMCRSGAVPLRHGRGR
jgi:hypothetical protein